MNYYITSNGTLCEISDQYLMHHGVKGMKWGKRKARPDAMGNPRSGRSANQEDRNSEEAKAARKAKVKKAVKIGAAVAGTALAAYGGYKLAKYVQGKRSQAAMKMAQDYVDKNVLHLVGDTAFADGTRRLDFSTMNGGRKITTQAKGRDSWNRLVEPMQKHNAEVTARGRQMYENAMNNRVDRGLAKVVNAGDAVSNATKRATASAANKVKSAGNAVKTSANKAKNTILDVMDPIYDYTPGETTTRSRDVGNGIKVSEAVTKYYKTKKKRI